MTFQDPGRLNNQDLMESIRPFFFSWQTVSGTKRCYCNLYRFSDISDRKCHALPSWNRRFCEGVALKAPEKSHPFGTTWNTGRKGTVLSFTLRLLLLHTIWVKVAGVQFFLGIFLSLQETVLKRLHRHNIAKIIHCSQHKLTTLEPLTTHRKMKVLHPQHMGHSP